MVDHWLQLWSHNKKLAGLSPTSTCVCGDVFFLLLFPPTKKIKQTKQQQAYLIDKSESCEWEEWLSLRRTVSGVSPTSQWLLRTDTCSLCCDTTRGTWADNSEYIWLVWTFFSFADYAAYESDHLWEHLQRSWGWQYSREPAAWSPSEPSWRLPIAAQRRSGIIKMGEVRLHPHYCSIKTSICNVKTLSLVTRGHLVNWEIQCSYIVVKHKEKTVIMLRNKILKFIVQLFIDSPTQHWEQYLCFCVEKEKKNVSILSELTHGRSHLRTASSRGQPVSFCLNHFWNCQFCCFTLFYQTHL